LLKKLYIKLTWSCSAT